MKRLGRDAAELTALADHLTAHGLVLEMLAGPLPGMYAPSGPGRLLFAFFAAMAETERENIRESTLEGLGAAARKGRAPSVASIYRALAEHGKQEAYPEAVAQAHADFADLQDADGIPHLRRVHLRRPDDPLTPAPAGTFDLNGMFRTAHQDRGPPPAADSTDGVEPARWMVWTPRTGSRAGTRALVAMAARCGGAAPTCKAVTYSMTCACVSVGIRCRSKCMAMIRPLAATVRRTSSCRSSTAVRLVIFLTRVR
ncbi:recombinase family protein [Streptomyces sp. NPDC056296]|uniref:recombinase family protein n=1 Tax=Streptomyces sp. NPDC056296 TaxID=3345775 RepID=UPI0035DEC79A